MAVGHHRADAGGGGGGGSDQASRQLYAAMYDMQRTLTALADRLERVGRDDAQAAAGGQR